VKSTSKILAKISKMDGGKQFITNFNASLAHNWEIYEAGLRLCISKAKRREVAFG